MKQHETYDIVTTQDNINEKSRCMVGVQRSNVTLAFGFMGKDEKDRGTVEVLYNWPVYLSRGISFLYLNRYFG